MHAVTTRTAIGFHGHVFVEEGSLLFGVTLEAGGVAARRRPHLAQRRCAVDVMAVCAFQQTLVYAVMVGTRKLGAGCGVAAVTKIGLFLDQQVLFFFGVMRAVTIQTTDLTAGMGRSGGMLMLPPVAMALETACVDGGS